jgi:maltodextrin utilization protein YvdJ
LELTESVKQTIEKFKKWISQNKPEGMNSTDWQELLASIHYIQHRTYLEDKNREKVADFLLMKKNWYTKAQVLHAYDVLAKSGLITNEVNTLS